MECIRSRKKIIAMRRASFLVISVLVLFTVFYLALYIENDQFNEVFPESSNHWGKDSDPESQARFTAAAHNLVNSFTSDLMAMANMGAPWATIDKLRELIGTQESLVLPKLVEIHERIQQAARKPTARVRVATLMQNNSECGVLLLLRVPKMTRDEAINVAAVSCGWRREQLATMTKTVVMFAQDVPLHFILFSDGSTILEVAKDILELKWTVNALGRDFTYELHLDWFPDDNVGWRKMYAPCATQRLFFPSLLPHIDSLIYLDADILVLSNLTDFWLQFQQNMKDEKMAALAANNELTSNGWYNQGSRVPHYGKRGLNAGVMLMNLTRMREFNFEKRALAAQLLYESKLDLADQDIINIIFNGFPERVHQLDCSYNFNWVHCGDDGSMCEAGKSYCFCNATFTHGVQILHGNGGTFIREEYYRFLVDIYNGFSKFDLLNGSVSNFFSELSLNFTSYDKPCGSLSADILFRNARQYFLQIESQAR